MLPCFVMASPCQRKGMILYEKILALKTDVRGFPGGPPAPRTGTDAVARVRAGRTSRSNIFRRFYRKGFRRHFENNRFFGNIFAPGWVRTGPNTCPIRAEQVGISPKTSKSVRKRRKHYENLRKLAKNIEKKTRSRLI